MANEYDAKKEINPNIILKSAKNMAGYAEDKEIDPKLLQVGELVRAAAEEDSEVEGCSDEDLMKAQAEKEEALEEQRYHEPIR